VDDACAGLEDVMLGVDLDQLKGSTRSIALVLGTGDIRVVELALEPELGGERAALAGLDPDFQRTLGHRAPAPSAPRSPTPASRTIFTSMPSRSPRSATRSRRHGNARRMASRMAQPASTRSARSAPMQALATRSS